VFSPSELGPDVSWESYISITRGRKAEFTQYSRARFIIPFPFTTKRYGFMKRAIVKWVKHVTSPHNAGIWSVQFTTRYSPFHNYLPLFSALRGEPVRKVATLTQTFLPTFAISLKSRSWCPHFFLFFPAILNIFKKI